MAAKPLPDQALLLKLLRYEPETGNLYWRERGSEFFNSAGKHKCWNKRFAGQRGSTNHGEGYLVIRILGSQYLAHRVIWRMVTGEEPNLIDHINGVRSDNRFCNIRTVSPEENMRNVSHTSGTPHLGVRWVPEAKKWDSRIKFRSKTYLLGQYLNVDDAIRARKAAERRFGFHPNNGRAAPKQMGIAKRARDAARDAEIVRLRETGLPYHQIGKIVGLDTSYVCRIYKAINCAAGEITK